MTTNQDSRETNLWWMKPDFFNCLKTVGVTENKLTIKQIIEYLNKYILLNKLFNLNEGVPPKTFYLGDDPLSKVLGVKQFTVPELKILLPYQIIAVTSKKDHNGQNSRSEEDKNAILIKRKLNDEEAGDLSDPKKGRHEEDEFFKYGTFVVPRAPTYFSGDETDYSVQSLETEYVRDSGDDILLYDGTLSLQEYHNARNNILSSGDEGGIEYEVESASSLSSGCSDTSSDEEDIVCAALVITQDDSDMPFWADESDEDTIDPELTLADKWSCCHCGGLNDPLSRFCGRCWDMRVHWLPEKKKHHPPTNIKKKQRPPRPVNKVLPLLKSTKYESADFSSPNWQETSEKINSGESLPSTSQDQSQYEFSSQDSGISPAEKSEVNSIEIPDGAVNKSDKILPNCPICQVNPKTGIFIHGNTSHQYCCYKCAKIIQKSRQKCPVCRRSILKVVRNFLVL